MENFCLKNIEIENFKCFEKANFQLDPHFNVFIGNNASGKTSVLDGISVVLGELLFGVGIKAISSSGQGTIEGSNIRSVIIDGQPKRQYPSILQTSLFTEQKMYQIRTSVLGNNQSVLKNYGSGIYALFGEKLKQSQTNSGLVFPLIAYYGTGRLWGIDDKKVSFQKQEDGIQIAYNNCLTPNASGKAFQAWYKTLVAELLENPNELDQSFRNALDQAISKMIPEWGEMGYSFKQDDIIGKLNGELRFFRQLSDGYRNTLGMVADMIYRSIQLNPHLREKVLEETPGIVLIDELDLHLHPLWQRRIVSNLKEIFPRVQFITTTHSPFIIQSLKDSELINLDEWIGTPNIGLDDDPNKYSIEEIAEVEMGVKEVQRSQDFLAMMETAEEYYKLISEGHSSKSNKQVAALKEKLDELELKFNQDPAYVALLKAERKSSGL
jgi:predicted ATP-binding protein involved in virulence